MRVRGEQITLDGYTITGLLGSGGTGNVLEAEQHSMRRTVAIKLLQPELADDPEFRARMEREAVAIGNLSHPNIIAVHDFVETRGFLAIVMQYVDGGSLMDAIRVGINGGEALRVLKAVAAALDYAHGRLLHRDIKPHNVLLERDGPGVFLADFGLVKLDGAALTQTGRELMGTWAYMAPELLRGRPASPATDRYALAVTAYQALTAGGYPFPGGQDLRARRPSLREQPPLPFAGDSPAATAAAGVFARALAVDPAERPETAAALIEQLADALDLDRAVSHRNPAFEQHIEPAHTFASWDTGAALDETHVPDLEPLTAAAAPGAELDVPNGSEEQSAAAARAPADRSPRPRRLPTRAPAFAIGALLLSGAAGAAALALGDRGERPPNTATIAAGQASFTAPAGTAAVTEPGPIAKATLGDLNASNVTAIGTPQSGVALATVTERTTPLTVSADARGRVVDIAGGRARQYEHDGTTTVFAQTPTTVVKLACTASSAHCDEAIRTLRLGDENLQADPIATVAAQLQSALDLARDRRTELQLPARDLTARARRASALATSYSQAAEQTGDVAETRPRDRDLRMLAQELGDAADAYEAIAAAARQRSSAEDRRGRQQLEAADRALRNRRALLTSRGYQLRWPSTQPPAAARIERATSSTSTSSSSTGSSIAPPAEDTTSDSSSSNNTQPSGNRPSGNAGAGNACELGPC